MLLSYDDLPTGSDIRREYSPGLVRIVVPAGRGQPTGMGQLLRDALAWGAASSGPLLLLAGVLFYLGIYLQKIDGLALIYAWLFFVLFCISIVMLMAWVRFGVLGDAVRMGRRQMTALAATPQRLLIETAGPFGNASYDFPADSIRKIRIERSALLDEMSRRRLLLHLTLELADGRSIRVLPGRDRVELTSVGNMLHRTLEIPRTEP